MNCLVVMDEARRYISYGSSDPQIAELTMEIVDSVRTTRKYGIGYMFITQTIESLDKEILQQIRIFAFGYGLTVGNEIKIISNLVNNESAIQLYRSFLDPSSNHKYPFMFFGLVSPSLSRAYRSSLRSTTTQRILGNSFNKHYGNNQLEGF